MLSDTSIIEIRENFKMNKNTILVKNDFQMTSATSKWLRVNWEIGKNPKNEKGYKCKYCKKRFTRKNNMNYHIKHKCKEKDNIRMNWIRLKMR